MAEEQQALSPGQALSISVVSAGEKAQINVISWWSTIYLYVIVFSVNQTFNSPVVLRPLCRLLQRCKSWNCTFDSELPNT